MAPEPGVATAAPPAVDDSNPDAGSRKAAADYVGPEIIPGPRDRRKAAGP